MNGIKDMLDSHITLDHTQNQTIKNANKNIMGHMDRHVLGSIPSKETRHLYNSKAGCQAYTIFIKG
jgi:hypothetical protein